MEEIIQYKAIDGNIFATQDECCLYEELLCDIKNAEKYIIKNNGMINNDQSGIQNPLGNIINFNAAFRTILTRYIPTLVEKWDINPRGIIGRYLSDGDNSIYIAIYDLYYSCIMCVGKDGKSYAQPYYANRIGYYPDLESCKTQQDKMSWSTPLDGQVICIKNDKEK